MTPFPRPHQTPGPLWVPRPEQTLGPRLPRREQTLGPLRLPRPEQTVGPLWLPRPNKRLVHGCRGANKRLVRSGFRGPDKCLVAMAPPVRPNAWSAIAGSTLNVEPTLVASNALSAATGSGPSQDEVTAYTGKRSTRAYHTDKASAPPRMPPLCLNQSHANAKHPAYPGVDPLGHIFPSPDRPSSNPVGQGLRAVTRQHTDFIQVSESRPSGRCSGAERMSV